MRDAAGDDRLVQLEGAYNFRDIGGYATEGGGTVAWGQVFRAATLARLTDADHAVIDTLSIKVICDLRSSHERQMRPSRLAATGSITAWARDYETSVADMVRAMAAPGATAELSRQKMVDIYRTLMYEQADSYREVFGRIADGALPLVFHCSAGKDRTGLAAALLLDLLGVARATIFEDYLLTNRFYKRGCAMILDDPGSRRLGAIDQAIWAPMMRAEHEYLTTAFSVIDQAHGSTEAYVREVLALSPVQIAQIREVLTG